jgi:hypothetical protein
VSLNDHDRALVALVPDTLRRGRQLMDWAHNQARSEARWFDVGITHNPQDKFQGFFGEPEIDGVKIPVMAAVQDLFFDCPRREQGESDADRQLALEAYRVQLRRFALKYFLRAAENHQRTPAPDGHPTQLPWLLDKLSWAPKPDNRETGFCFEQIYSQRNGEVSKFPEEVRSNIIDAERVTTEYDWLVLRTRLLNATFNLSFWQDGPQLVVPAVPQCHLAMDRNFIFDQTPADAHLSGRYGCGYTMIRFGKTPWPFVYGPGAFEIGLQLNEFEIHRETGECRVKLMFIVNRPEKLMSILGFDPVSGYVKFANWISGGAASRKLDISMDRVGRFILFTHSSMYFDVIAATLRIFRQTPNWLDEATIPEWLLHKTGQ